MGKSGPKLSEAKAEKLRKGVRAIIRASCRRSGRDQREAPPDPPAGGVSTEREESPPEAQVRAADAAPRPVARRA